MMKTIFKKIKHLQIIHNKQHQDDIEYKRKNLQKIINDSTEIAEEMDLTIRQLRENSPISPDLKQNIKTLKDILGISDDIIFREFNFGCKKQVSGSLLFVDGMADKDMINSNIMKPLMYDTCLIPQTEDSYLSNLDIINKYLLSVSDVKPLPTLSEVLDNLLAGDTILLIDGANEALAISSRKWESRGVQEPKTDNVVRGPREGFTETLRINTTLIRRKIRNTNLCIETFPIGEKTRTDICIIYLKGVANPKLITELKERLHRIQTDAILESGYIEAFIEDEPYSIFSTVGNSEKPDTVAAKILEGRAAILVDGTPFVLTVPMLFIEGFQSAEDYYSRPYYSSFIRMIRFAAFLISILAPATYVALTTFHQELIPTALLFTMAAGHQGVPFPAVFEAFLMMVMFDILREAGVRLPRPVGSAVSIVGALVLGESAVTAGLISPMMVIVVALTAIASFLVPPQTDSASILRYFLLVLAGMMGGLGIMVGLLAVLIHLASIRSFGTPYFSPIVPLTLSGFKDTFIRMPLWKMSTRPKTIAWHDHKRQNVNPPSPPDKDN